MRVKSKSMFVHRAFKSSRLLIPVVAFAFLFVAGCDLDREDARISANKVPYPAPVDTATVPNAPEPAPRVTPPVLTATLGVGDPAPELHLDQWVLGSPADEGFNGKVHVVEFWATWCGPCRTSMPHISELQQHHGDSVTFIGVTREDVATVNKFLDTESPDGRLWRDVVQYRLATDAGDATNTAYMKAAAQRGIPTAFVVGSDGNISWIGHPARIDQPLQQVVDGVL